MKTSQFFLFDIAHLFTFRRKLISEAAVFIPIFTTKNQLCWSREGYISVEKYFRGIYTLFDTVA